MIRRPSVVSVIVEYGYLSNPSEARLFATDEYIRVAANATADAIDAYLHSDRPGAGFIQEPRAFNPKSASTPCNDPTLE
ncbi:MAG: N-acetylmuramoyl-L-alanine amidase [Acidimicrobiaceae bacterium]|nr:N-acetylmuramoyl-L-alanine amidase [Acidimicrobiaceae bacterium]